ncbi:hypothetical protein [Parasitella parasitica]|uniref:Uncharacterized protein n=1 Tax=Parasitella parasitica TaxID=35722 RepID=A0A0B7N7M1_9FUNG|nr:hypothetical protein [Parasitella parasitica]
MNVLSDKTNVPKRKDLTEWQIGGIVNCSRAGVKQSVICKTMGLSPSTVHDVLLRAGKTGDGIPRKRSGGAKALNKRDERALVCQVRAEPLKPMKYHLGAWCEGHTKISIDTFRKYLKGNGFQSYKAAQHGVNTRTRQLYVLKKEYIANLAKNIVMFLPNHQNHIKQLKEQGYEIVGYARKSPGEQLNRLANLTAMVNKLKERSLVDKCFVSRVCNASDKLGERDLRDTSTSNIQGTQGNTLDMIGYIASSNKKICLVVIDFAGLSTNQQNIYDFVHILYSYLRLSIPPKSKRFNTDIWNEIYLSYKCRKNIINTYHEEAIETLTIAAIPAGAETRHLINSANNTTPNCPTSPLNNDNNESTQREDSEDDIHDESDEDNDTTTPVLNHSLSTSSAGEVSSSITSLISCITKILRYAESCSKLLEIKHSKVGVRCSPYPFPIFNFIVTKQQSTPPRNDAFFGNKVYQKIRKDNLDSFNMIHKFPGKALLETIKIAQNVYEKSNDRISAAFSLLSITQSMEEPIDKKLILSASQLLPKGGFKSSKEVQDISVSLLTMATISR